jgi:hypothetical protein
MEKINKRARNHFQNGIKVNPGDHMIMVMA